MSPPKNPLILVVDDEPNVGMIFHKLLGESGYDVVSASGGEEALRVLHKQEPSLVFLDLRMPGIDGIETLRRIRETHVQLPVVMMTAYKTIESAVESMKLGALDYLLKPLDMDMLRDFVKHSVEIGEKMRAAPQADLNPKSVPSSRFVAVGAEMKNVIGLVDKVASTDLTVLILGPSGTGKEVIARAIHDRSPRREKPFVVVDCAALPESLMESELFGYEKGAFTGADSSKVGKFESANAGTLFLDEIGNLSLVVQAKLLRFLQDPMIERLGGRKGPLRLDVRILAATNANLEGAVKAGTFREDLLHRLKVFPISLPPLRRRGSQEIEALIKFILQDFSQKLGKRPLSVSPETLQLLADYRWPGNIRELQNALKSAALLSDGLILPAHLPMSIQMNDAHFSENPQSAEALAEALSDVVKRVEKDNIITALRMAGGDKAKAAHSLGLDLTALAQKIEEYKIQAD